MEKDNSNSYLKKLKTNLIGERRGHLLVIKYLRSENSANIWLCKCDCGKYKEMSTAYLNNKKIHNKSCGKCEYFFSRRFKGEISEIPRQTLASIKTGAKERNLILDVDEEFLWSLFLKQNKKCALSNRELVFHNDSKKNTASLDRIDSKEGYIKTNVQWIHKDINIMKNKYPQDYFLNICEDIYNKHKNCIQKVDRPEWMDYFLGMTLVVAQRSIDAQTKCGAIITSPDHKILGTGYNSFSRGLPDEKIPNLRPNKYDFIIHAENNCLINCTGLTHQYEYVNMYISMRPCFQCLKLILNYNIKNLFIIERPVSLKTDENKDIWELLIHHSNINYMEIKPKIDWLYNAKVDN